MALMTVSDDCSWKLWSFPSNEYITGAKEHKDWIADIDIHQKYLLLCQQCIDILVLIGFQGEYFCDGVW